MVGKRRQIRLRHTCFVIQHILVFKSLMFYISEANLIAGGNSFRLHPSQRMLLACFYFRALSRSQLVDFCWSGTFTGNISRWEYDHLDECYRTLNLLLENNPAHGIYDQTHAAIRKRQILHLEPPKKRLKPQEQHDGVPGEGEQQPEGMSQEQARELARHQLAKERTKQTKEAQDRNHRALADNGRR